MDILKPTVIEFAIGNIISDILLLIFCQRILSFQYILIKYHVQIGLPSYTMEHSIWKAILD